MVVRIAFGDYAISCCRGALPSRSNSFCHAHGGRRCHHRGWLRLDRTCHPLVSSRRTNQFLLRFDNNASGNADQPILADAFGCYPINTSFKSFNRLAEWALQSLDLSLLFLFIDKCLLGLTLILLFIVRRLIT